MGGVTVGGVTEERQGCHTWKWMYHAEWIERMDEKIRMCNRIKIQKDPN